MKEGNVVEEIGKMTPTGWQQRGVEGGERYQKH